MKLRTLGQTSLYYSLMFLEPLVIERLDETFLPEIVYMVLKGIVEALTIQPPKISSYISKNISGVWINICKK